MYTPLRLIILVFFMSISSAILADIPSPKDQVSVVASDLFAALKVNAENTTSNVSTGDKPSSVTANQVAAEEAKVLKILARIVDFKSISRGVTGKHKKLLSPSQKQAFQREFEQSIVKIITGAFDSLTEYTLTVKDAKMKDETHAQVPVEISISSSEKYEILFSLSFKKNKWRVRNLIVNGINLGITYRNQFNESMKAHKQDVEAVINAWADTSESASQE